MNLNDANFVTFALRHYKQKACFVTKEFFKDLGKVNTIKRHLKNYKLGKELKHRIILNSIITLNNCFGVLPSCNMIIFKLKDYHQDVFPFLLYLKMIPENSGIYVELNREVVEKLRKL
jgi:hypothetical protein